MKNLIAMVLALVLVAVVPTIVSATEAHKGASHISGSITSWDDARKLVSVKDSAGKEHSIMWNEKTKVEGTPKVGEHASVTYTKDQDGMMMATHVRVGAKPASTKAATK